MICRKIKGVVLSLATLYAAMAAAAVLRNSVVTQFDLEVAAYFTHAGQQQVTACGRLV